MLDPEQNTSFQDHYLDVEYDLSQVLFVATANVLHTIPGPLQDRMEILRLHGYTEIEKLEIAKQYLVKKQLEGTGLTEKQIVFDDDALREIIRAYTREAGVRNLEREIGNVCRKVARNVVKKAQAQRDRQGGNIERACWAWRSSAIRRYRRRARVGLVTGLAWTEMGGGFCRLRCRCSTARAR